jgi:hypothetical protein
VFSSHNYSKKIPLWEPLPGIRPGQPHEHTSYEGKYQVQRQCFSFLFSNPGLLRELYCALKNVTLPADVPVTINTLRNVLFLDRVDDISFEIGGKPSLFQNFPSFGRGSIPIHLNLR